MLVVIFGLISADVLADLMTEHGEEDTHGWPDADGDDDDDPRRLPP